MPDNDTNLTPLSGTLQRGEGMVIQSESNDKPATGGETPGTENKNENISNVSGAADEAANHEQETDDSNSFVSGSKKARELGESRRKFAQIAIDLAVKDEEARAKLVESAKTDPQVEKYYQKHFPKEYQKVFLGKSEDDISTEELSNKEIAKLQAAAELLTESFREEKALEAEELAANLGFNMDEMVKLKSLAEKLETDMGGWSQALRAAAMAIRPDKAKVKSNMSAGAAPQPASKTAHQLKVEAEKRKLEELAGFSAKKTGRSKQDIMKNLDIVNKHIKEGGNRLEMPFDL